MKEKFFLLSKTIVGILVAAFAFFFGDQFGMPDDVKKWLVGFGLALAGLGRFVADGKLTVFPKGGKGGPPGANGNPAPVDKRKLAY